MKKINQSMKIILTISFLLAQINFALAQNKDIDTIFVERDYSQPIIQSTAELFLDTREYMITDGEVYGLVDVETTRDTLYYNQWQFNMVSSKVTYNHLSAQAYSQITTFVYLVDSYVHNSFSFINVDKIVGQVNDTISEETFEVISKYLKHDTDYDLSPLDIQIANDSLILDMVKLYAKNMADSKEN